MCYDIRFLTKKKLQYAKRFGTGRDIEDLEKQLEELEKRIVPHYHTSGFEHPDVPVITNQEPDKIQLFNWGLIPKWIKDPKSAVEISNKTLNARGELMFEKPSFKHAAKHHRCLVIIDGFYEHHWIKNKSFPYHIFMKNDEPFALGGIWETWEYPDEEIIRNTFSIVTTEANPLLTRIHNKPKASIGPRMPLIIPEEFENTWLKSTTDPVDIQEIKDLIKPYDAEEMDAFTVPRLKGKLAVGNVKRAIEYQPYPELTESQGNLF